MNRLLSAAVLVCISFCCFALPAYSELSDYPQTATWGTNGPVNNIVVSGGRVYVAGSFSQVGPSGAMLLARKNIAAMDAANGQFTNWDTGPSSGNEIQGIHISGGTAYVCGDFTNIGGYARYCLAALNLGTGQVTSWNPGANGYVRSLAGSGSAVYVSGDFSFIGGSSRAGLAKLGLTGNGNAAAWNPNLGGMAGLYYTMAVSSTTLYVGGLFTSIGGVSRNFLAAIDLTTGALKAWNPNPNGAVYALSVCGDTVYAGGNFTSVNGVPCNRIAAIDAATGIASPLGSGANGMVYALAATNTTIYVGGNFTEICGAPRNYLAALNASYPVVTSWMPNPNGQVFSLALNGETLFAGGAFTRVNGFNQPYFAQFGPYFTLSASSVMPVSAYNTAAAELTVTGAHFAEGATVKVGGQAGAVEYINATTLRALMPTDMPPGLKNVVVTNPDGQSVTLADAFTVVAPLGVFDISPSSGPISGGTTVTLRGSGFVNGASVKIGSFMATGIVVVGTGTLRCVMPRGAAMGAKDVVVTLPDEQTQTLAGAFTYVPLTAGGSTVDPSTGGTVTIEPESGSITVDVPGGAFNSAVTLSVSTAAVPASSQDAVRVTNVGIEISNSGGLQPSREIAITVYYRDADIAGRDESKLSLARYENGRWIPIPTVVYADQNKLVGTVRHLSTFAVVQLVPMPDLGSVKAYPNPFRPANGSLTIANLTGEADIRIYTVAGELIRTVGYAAGTGQAVWDGKNDAGRDAASGVYLVLIKSGAGNKTIKVAIER